MTSTKSKNTKRSTSKMSHKKSKVEMKIPDAWINELKTLQINDTSWSCLVSLFVEQRSDMTIYTDHFNEAAIDGNRLAVKAISTLVVARTVIKNMADANSGDPVTPLALLCREIYKAVGPDIGENIPTELLAPLIKYIILEYKEWNKKVQEGINRAQKGLDEYQQGLWSDSKLNSLGKKSKSQEKSVTSDKTAKLKTKTFTKLRRRGEEWKDIQWIDDSPLDGPNLYIVISTFYDVNLVLELLKLDIPLQAVMKMDLAKSLMDQKDIMEHLADFRQRSLPFLSIINNERLSIAQLERIISSFWDRLEYQKTSTLYASLYKDIMFLNFYPQINDFQFQLKEFQEDIYREITYFLYNAFEITKLHKNYLRQMEIKDVSDNNVCLLSKMEVYNSIVDNIPHEVLTIPLILEALLTEICDSDRSTGTFSKEGEDKMEKTDSESMINESLIKFLDNLNLKYDLPCDNAVNVQPRVSSANTLEKKQQTVLQYSDDIKLRTFHLDSQLAEFVVCRSNSFLKTAWKGMLDMECSYKINSSFNKLCNEIVRIHQETNNDSLYYLVHLIVINNALNSLLLLNASKGPSKQASTSQIFLCRECDKDFGVSVRSYMSNRTNSSGSMDEDTIISNMFFIENMSSEILFQNIQAFNHNYNWLEKRYCPYTGQIILVFHNIPHYCEEEWVGKLTTPVPRRDFVEYILDEQKMGLGETVYETYDGLLSENTSLYLNIQQENTLLRKIQDFSDSDMQFISHRSIKYETLLKQGLSQAKSKRFSVTGSSTLHVESMKSSSLNKLKSDYLNRKEVTFRNKDNQESVFLEEDETQDYTFLGYDQGEPMRFQFNGCKKSKSLGRNCKVNLDTFKKLYGEEFIRVNIKICGNNLFYTHNPETDSITPFHLVLSSGIVLHFGLPCSAISPSENIHSPTQLIEFKVTQEPLKPAIRNTLQHQLRYNIKESVYYEVPFLYKLNMSTPSGLHVELEKGNKLLYVRQTQLSKPFVCTTHGKEKFRCCLSSGFILKFFINGKVIALGPNGEIYAIYRNNRHSESKHEDSEVHVKKASNLSHINKKSGISTKSGQKKLNTKNNKSSTAVYNDKINTYKSSHTEYTEEQYFNSSFNNPSIYIYDYNFTTSDGKQYKVLGTNIEPLEELLITSYIDILNNCIISERSDGVTTKHLGDGSLMVRFPDGSQVTSIPVQIEDVFCEWTAEELVNWFVPSVNEMTNIGYPDEESVGYSNKGSNYTLNDFLKQNNTSQNMRSLPSYTSNSNECTYGKLDYAEDGFVVYNISYRLEHNCYGVVYFDSKSCQIDFELPQSTKITLENDGSYKANFDSASLSVDKNKITFNKLNEAGGVEVTNTIYKSNLKINATGNTNQENYPDSDEGIQFKSLSGLMDHESKEREINACVLFSSKDCFGNEMYIDYNLHFHNLSQNKELNIITINDIACFVIDRDFKGYRIVSRSEADEYIRYVSAEGGLVRENKENCKSIFTSIGIARNELEKWLMAGNKERSYKMEKRTCKTSTFGKKESWCQIFREKPEDNTNYFQVSDVMVIRLLHKIESEDMLSYLQKALKTFKKRGKSTQPLRLAVKKHRCKFNIDEILTNTDILLQIYKEENVKKAREEDKPRKYLKDIFTSSLVRQACIKSKNLRLNTKVEEMKTIFRTKTIPPYYSSCFGSVHNILNEVIERVHDCHETLVGENIQGKIPNNVDSILNFISRNKATLKSSKADSKVAIHTKENAGTTGLVTDISGTISSLSEDRSRESIVRSILEKPLDLLTSDDVDFLCLIFESQPGQCPILVSEEVILQDILEASHQLSHYFSHLKHMLEFYRVHKQIQRI